mmetsp:Transcript_12499/g.12541  ORF Transcript_12499/g.12541 Transcript_12499/m.12541 type:complete len:226 (+) Transcript_12499:136-813(+)
MERTKGSGTDMKQLQEEIHKLQEELKQKEHTIEAFEEESKRMHHEIENLKRKFNLLSQGPYAYPSITTHHTNITGRDIQFDPETILELDLSDPKHLKFLSSLDHKMPDLGGLTLSKIPEGNEDVKTFLQTGFPSEVREFTYNYSSSQISCLDLYVEELAAVSQRVKEVLYVYGFEVSESNLVTLLAANKHKAWFGFPDCKLSLSSVPDFGGKLEGSTLKGFGLSG